MLLNYLFAEILRISDFHIIVFSIGIFSTISIVNATKSLDFINKSAFILLVVTVAVSLFSDVIRQCISFFILLYGLVRIQSISYLNWTILCIFAAMFHSSALLMIPYKFVVTRLFTLNRRIIWFLICAVLITILNGINSFLGFFEDLLPTFIFLKLDVYSSNLTDNAKFGFFLLIDCVMIFLLLQNKCDAENTYSSDLIYKNATIVYFSLHIVFYFAPFLQRITFYMLPLVIVFFLRKAYEIKKSDILIVMLFIFSAFAAFYKLVTNEYYSFDFYHPKFLYLQLIGLQDVNLESLYYEKCSHISQYDPSFCK